MGPEGKLHHPCSSPSTSRISWWIRSRALNIWGQRWTPACPPSKPKHNSASICWGNSGLSMVYRLITEPMNPLHPLHNSFMFLPSGRRYKVRLAHKNITIWRRQCSLLPCLKCFEWVWMWLLSPVREEFLPPCGADSNLCLFTSLINKSNYLIAAICRHISALGRIIKRREKRNGDTEWKKRLDRPLASLHCKTLQTAALFQSSCSSLAWAKQALSECFVMFLVVALSVIAPAWFISAAQSVCSWNPENLTGPWQPAVTSQFKRLLKF